MRENDLAKEIKVFLASRISLDAFYSKELKTMLYFRTNNTVTLFGEAGCRRVVATISTQMRAATKTDSFQEGKKADSPRNEMQGGGASEEG